MNPSALSHSERLEYMRALVDTEEEFFAPILARAKEQDEQAEHARAEARERRGMPTQNRLHHAALHEAGHAVVAALSGAGVLGCLIRDDGSGACWVQGSDDMVCLAGAGAARLAGHVTAEPSSSDRALIRGNRREATLASFDAQDLLAENWRKVERLAGMLVDLGYVSGQLVHEITGSGYA